MDENSLIQIGKEIQDFVISDADSLEAFRLAYCHRKSKLSALFKHMGEVSPEGRRAFGIRLNALKKAADTKFSHAKTELSKISVGVDKTKDLTLSDPSQPLGSIHPLTQVRREIVHIFQSTGFSVSEGPEIEDDWHNFSALNFPNNHPARDMQDTFFIEKEPDILLRTHTSSVQVRTMENGTPPIRTISPGRVYRNETISARAHCVFHQVEGLYIDKKVSFLDMKETLWYFARQMFGEETNIRLRPSYFPFTEPSAEMDISCHICQAKGCKVCKHSAWVEILGCGMVDPAVLEASGIDPNEYNGFAFGMGIERIAMLKYKINDLRLFTENDVRFLKQFTAIS